MPIYKQSNQRHKDENLCPLPPVDVHGCQAPWLGRQHVQVPQRLKSRHVESVHWLEGRADSTRLRSS